MGNISHNGTGCFGDNWGDKAIVSSNWQTMVGEGQTSDKRGYDLTLPPFLSGSSLGYSGLLCGVSGSEGSLSINDFL